MVTILRCWWQKQYIGDIFLHVDDISIGRQHHNMPEYDVTDPYVMLLPNSRCWSCELSSTSKYCHHYPSPTSVTNIDGIVAIIQWQLLMPPKILSPNFKWHASMWNRQTRMSCRWKWSQLAAYHFTISWKWRNSARSIRLSLQKLRFMHIWRRPSCRGKRFY